MKRLLSLLMACVLVLSVVAACPVFVSATNEVTEPSEEQEVMNTTEPETTEPETTEPEETEPVETDPPADGMITSDDLIALLKFEEGFCKYPVWDYSQYTVGYGTRCPDNMLSYYRANGITDAEAEALLRSTLANTEYLINTKLIDRYNLDMTQGQFDALVAFSYNMGPGWITSPSQNIHQQVAAGATGNTIIDALSRWCKAGGAVKSFLVRRRLSESYMYIEGKYAHTPPSNYCYVIYNGNGGSTSQSVQGYNADYKGAPTGTASHSSYSFAGWYTSPTGGVKVDVLTQEYDKATLYAHWEGVSYREPELFDEPITVKVTTNNVNLRKGPGTNYAIVGRANTGDQYQIWQIEAGGSYTWGYYKGGWIALEYTNYEDVVSGNEEEPTEPEATEPEETPAPTEPEPTEPEATAPAKTVTGVVNADPYLCVRKGPGTGYATVDTLRTGERVEITEQKTVGSMIWGKISNGWISMSYVTVKEDFESETDKTPESTSGQIGTVTCSMLNVRHGAGVSYGIVGSFRQGDTVTITEQKTVGTTTWGKTSKGWVSMDYISIKSSGTTEGGSGSTGNTGTPDTPAQGGTTTTQKITGTVISNDVLRVRSGAGTNYGVVGYLNPNTKVEILEKKTVGATTWGKVSKGWISLDYVRLDSTNNDPEALPDDKFDEEETTPAMVKTVNVSCLLIRSGAGTGYNKVGYLYKGAKVTVTETVQVGGNTWGKIANGWICLDYTV